MQEHLDQLLNRRTNAAIAAIMRSVERAGVGAPEVAQVRATVRDLLHGYHRMVVDVVEELEAASGSEFNALWLDKLDEIHQAVVGERPVERPSPVPAGARHRSPSDFGGGRPVTRP